MIIGKFFSIKREDATTSIHTPWWWNGIHSRLKICRPHGLASSSLALGMVIKEVCMETEKCVTCGIDTGVPVNEHVDLRKNYVEGAGQLCAQCWGKVYNQ